MLIGRLGKDPEVRYTQNGTPVATFSLATSEKWKDNGGNPQEKTNWHNIVLWNKLAEVAKRFLSKGALIYLEGKLTTRKWPEHERVERDGADQRLAGRLGQHLVELVGDHVGELLRGVVAARSLDRP